MKFAIPLCFLLVAMTAAIAENQSPAQASTTPITGPGTNAVIAATDSNAVTKDEVLKFLSIGEQDAAEAKLLQGLRREPENLDFIFLASVLARSRFDLKNSTTGFFLNLTKRPNSTEGMASACVLVIDGSESPLKALTYFNALLILAEENPESLPLKWLTAIEARTLTKNPESRNSLPPALRTKILQFGVSTYAGILESMKPSAGPVLIHQTLGNMLEQLQDYEGALTQREKALWLERRPWSLDAAANTLNLLDRPKEALPLIQEAIAQDPQDSSYQSKLGSILLKLGRQDEAIKAWQAGFALSHLASYPYSISLIYRDQGDYSKALQSIRQALALEPENKYYRVIEARFSALCGDPDSGNKIKEAGSIDFEGKPTRFEEKDFSNPWFSSVRTGDFHAIRKMLSIPDPAPGMPPTFTDRIRYRMAHDTRLLLNRLEQVGRIPLYKGTGVQLAQSFRTRFRIQDLSAIDAQSYNQTALMLASQYGWEQMAKDLLAEGAKLNQTDTNGDTALHYSIQFKQPRLAKLLLDASPDCSIQDRWHQTPLIMASVENDIPSVRMLLEKNVDPNTGTPHGGTPLQYAAAAGELQIVDLLINKGADVNLQAKNSGAFPLLVACRNAHTYVVKPLLAAGALIDEKDNHRKTALSESILPAMNAELVQLLVSKGASLTQSDSNGITPISKARILGWEELAKTWEHQSGTNIQLNLQSFMTNAPSGEQIMKTTAVTLPLLMEAGYFPQCVSSLSLSKKDAVRELSEKRGINNPETFAQVIRTLKQYDPSKSDYSSTSSQPSAIELGDLINKSFHQIRSSAPVSTQDETAWIQSHLIWITALGMSAGYISEEEGNALIRDSTNMLLQNYGSWQDFLSSYRSGARFNDGWSYQRYGYICDLILASGLPWPSGNKAGGTPPEVTSPSNSQQMLP